jgi:hypothetical protein
MMQTFGIGRSARRGPPAQAIHEVVQLWRLGAAYLFGPVHAEHDGTAVPVAHAVHPHGDEEGEQHAARAPERLPDEGKEHDHDCHERGGHDRHERGGAEGVHTRSGSLWEHL